MPTAIVNFSVNGRPAPKGSRTAGITKQGKAFTRPASKYEKDWTKIVSLACGPYKQLLPPYKVDVVYRIKQPAKPKYAWPSQSDIDKLDRCTYDGLILGGLIVDDSHIIAGCHTKMFGEEGCDITVETLK